MMSDDHVACRFDHTLAQSIVGYSCVIQMSLILLPAMNIVRTISYTLCLNALGIPLFLGGACVGHFQGVYTQVFQGLRYPPYLTGYTIADTICHMHSFGAGKICAGCQSFASN